MCSDLTLSEEVWQVFHGIGPDARDVLILSGMIRSQCWNSVLDVVRYFDTNLHPNHQFVWKHLRQLNWKWEMVVSPLFPTWWQRSWQPSSRVAVLKNDIGRFHKSLKTLQLSRIIIRFVLLRDNLWITLKLGRLLTAWSFRMFVIQINWVEHVMLPGGWAFATKYGWLSH